MTTFTTMLQATLPQALVPALLLILLLSINVNTVGCILCYKWQFCICAVSICCARPCRGVQNVVCSRSCTALVRSSCLLLCDSEILNPGLEFTLPVPGSSAPQIYFHPGIGLCMQAAVAEHSTQRHLPGTCSSADFRKERLGDKEILGTIYVMASIVFLYAGTAARKSSLHLCQTLLGC